MVPYLKCLLISCCFLIASAPVAMAEGLVAGNSYAVILERISNDGEGMIVGTDIVTADAAGVIEYSFSDVPNCSSRENPVSNSSNFLIITVIDEDELPTFQPHSGGAIVVATEKSSALFPAPSVGSTVRLGATSLSLMQTNGIMRSFKVSGADDPLLALIGMVVYRSELDPDQVQAIAIALHDQITHASNGFYAKLKEVSVTEAQINQFRSAIICEDFGDGEISFSSYMSETYQAVRAFADGSSSDEESKKRLEQAGEELGSILINAAAVVEPEITLQQLLHAVESIEFESTDEYTIDSSVQGLINSSLSSFFSRIRTQGQAQQWEAAMTALNASAGQISQFNTAVDTYLNAMTAARSGSYNDSTYDQIEYNYIKDIQADQAGIDALVTKVATYVDYFNPNSWFCQNMKVHCRSRSNCSGSNYVSEGFIPPDPKDHWFFEQFTKNRTVWFDFYYTQDGDQWTYNEELIPRTSIVQLLAYNFNIDYLNSGGKMSYFWVTVPWPWTYTSSQDSSGNWVSVRSPNPNSYTNCEADYQTALQNVNSHSHSYYDESDPYYFMDQLYVINNIQYSLKDLGTWRSVAYMSELEQHDAVSYATKCYPLYFELIKTAWEIDIPVAKKSHILNLLLGPQSDEIDQVSTQNAAGSGD